MPFGVYKALNQWDGISTVDRVLGESSRDAGEVPRCICSVVVLVSRNGFLVCEDEREEREYITGIRQRVKPPARGCMRLWCSDVERVKEGESRSREMGRNSDEHDSRIPFKCQDNCEGTCVCATPSTDAITQSIRRMYLVRYQAKCTQVIP